MMNYELQNMGPRHPTVRGDALRCCLSSSLAVHDSSLFSRGFTFAELLAAMVFVAIVIPVAVHGLTIANRAGVVADRKRVAAQLADRLLTEIIVTDDWRDGNRQGDFGEQRPGYRWIIDNDAWEEDAMRMVSVEVFFEVQGREYSIRLTTLVEETVE
ncbi:hypothetical protein AMJ85_07335 [candidate division BRC1 bacterium SM23_51]|nr:MAG: hypothetical protein AMJ85_07335 [candidate division BRC1 bacterium SM23_51]